MAGLPHDVPESTEHGTQSWSKLDLYRVVQHSRRPWVERQLRWTEVLQGALPRRTFIDVLGIEDFLDFTEIVAAVFVLLFEHGQKADLPVHRCKVTSQQALTKIIVQQQACTLFACVT